MTDAISDLQFDEITPLAPHKLGGLVRDHFSNGRLFATVAAHGGLTKLSHWGRLPFGGENFFQGDAESAWVKLFRFCARVGGKQYYLTLTDTRLYPFGFKSRCEVAGVSFEYDLLLLPDTLAQRVRILQNPQNLPVQLELIHQEEITAIAATHRTWGEFAFAAEQNALIASCQDRNPDTVVADESLSQKGLKVGQASAQTDATWIGVGCDTAMSVKRGFQPRSKYYLAGQPISGDTGTFYVTFAESREALSERLAQLAETVQDECDQLVADYTQRLDDRPQIDVSDPVLNSAFGQYPEIVQAMKVHDRPGATRANFSGYFVWGWDGMTPLISSALANEPEYTAQTLRFFQETRTAEYGIAHAFTTTFQTALKSPFPAQCQYIASLYHYVATTGDLAVAAEMFPTCQFILDRCRAEEVQGTGLIAGYSFWPDFPEAMGEDGNDISALNNSLMYQALRSMDYLARALGHPERADDCRLWAERLRVSWRKHLFDEEHGYFLSSCSSLTLEPRKHYPGQAIYWITPFARELVSHATGRIASFLDTELRSDKCLLTLPHWDTSWMADGNQLGSSYPTADYYYLNVHKLLGDDTGLHAWLGDVEWFWRTHTAPEAFTPEADNEADLGPDNPGGKQCQAVTCWYSCLYMGLAGMDFDHEGLTLTPWGNRPISIRNLKLHGVSVDLKISGSGPHVGSLTLNGELLPTGSRKIAWSSLSSQSAVLELVRTEQPPAHPTILRTDGLRVTSVRADGSRLSATIDGDIFGEIIVQTTPGAQVHVNGSPTACPYDDATRSVTIPFPAQGAMEIEVQNGPEQM